MQTNYDRKACLRRVKERLDEGTAESLRYAALELRCAIESICYDKLTLYKKHLSEDFSTWQPSAVIAVLEELDPNVNNAFNVYMTPEFHYADNPRTIKIGTQSTIDATLLKKHYHKLSQLLHVPLPHKPAFEANLEKHSGYLSDLLTRLEEESKNRFQCTVAETVSAKCKCCGKWIIRNYKSVQPEMALKCPHCDAQYLLEREGEGITWILQEGNWQCPVCETTNWMPIHFAQPGVAIECCECGSPYRLTLCVQVIGDQEGDKDRSS